MGHVTSPTEIDYPRHHRMPDHALPEPEAEFRELRNLLPSDALNHRNNGLDHHLLFGT